MGPGKLAETKSSVTIGTEGPDGPGGPGGPGGLKVAELSATMGPGGPEAKVPVTKTPESKDPGLGGPVINCAELPVVKTVGDLPVTKAMAPVDVRSADVFPGDKADGERRWLDDRRCPEERCLGDLGDRWLLSCDLVSPGRETLWGAGELACRWPRRSGDRESL